MGDGPLAAHLTGDLPGGDGPFGELLDEAILRLPTPRALRWRQLILTRSAAARFGRSGPTTRVLAVPGVPDTLALLVRLLSQATSVGEVELVVADSSRVALDRVERALHDRPGTVHLRLLPMDLVRITEGRASLQIPPQDLVIIDGLVDALPDRLVAATAAWASSAAAPDGMILVSALRSSADSPFFDQILGWPTVRRTAVGVRALLEAAGLRAAVVAGRDDQPEPAMVLAGRRRSGADPARSAPPVDGGGPRA